MSSELAIAVRNVSKDYRIYEKPEHRLVQMATLGRVRTFREFAALNDVTFDMFRGETIGIVGRNGCGKSTLLQIICGTLQPSAGSVEVRGRIAALLELGAGFNGEFTGRENVYMNGAILGLSREEMDAKFEEIARFASIGDFIERPVKTYSSGMFVRLAFAVATAVEPDILVVDEALAVGDEAFQRKCFARIEALKERGGTILFVSHSAGSIVQLCDRAVLLDAGEKLLEGKPKTVIAHYQRLINATPQNAQHVRNEIIAGVPLDIEQAEADVQVRDDAVDLEAKPDAGVAVDDAPRIDFDANLISQSITYTEERGATISDVSLRDASGRTVNILKQGHRYRVEFFVHFRRETSRIGFGFQVQNVNGIGIGGVLTTKSKSYPRQDAIKGRRMQVNVDFDCRFLPGVYFIAVGVYGDEDLEQVLLHRVGDAIMFRVPQEPNDQNVGMVDIGADVSVSEQMLEAVDA